MTDFRAIEAALKAPFAPDQVDWRVGSTNIDNKTGKPRREGDEPKGMALAYIDARAVMDRLDAVVGPDNWQDRYPHANGKTVCEIDIWIEGRGWVTKADGAGDTDHEAEKGALSDAFKRAAVRWGVGRYLYDLDSPWVKIEAFGKSWKIPAGERARLDKLLGGKAPARQAETTQQTSAAVLAACAAIDLCNSHEDLSTWAENNGEAIKSLPMPEAQAIRRHYSIRQDALRKAA
jgi:hypothetical protein